MRIAGICACLPERTVANEAKVAAATGIVTRRIAAEGTTVVDLCVKAAERVMSDTGSKPEDFGAILCVSFTSRDRMPAAAIQAQARLGLPKAIVAFDVSLACSGWGYGLYLAGLLARETGKKVLLLDGDVQSAFTGDDESTVPLLGDAGTATVVESGTGKWAFGFVADGEKGGALRLSHGESIKMDGFGVFRFVAADVVACIKDFQASVNRTIEQSPNRTMTFVPHQPNAYMVRQLAKSAGIDEARTAISCDELGNLSSASVPVTLARVGAANERRDRLTLLAGFGGGLSASAALLTLNADTVFENVDSGD